MGWGDEEAHASFPAYKVPIVADEPIGAAEQAIGGKRSATPSDFRDYARVCSLFGAGGTFHFDAGMRGEVPPEDSIQQACAAAFAEGLSDAIPLDAPRWQYTRGGLSDCPLEHSDATALRTFAGASAEQEGPRPS